MTLQLILIYQRQTMTLSFTGDCQHLAVSESGWKTLDEILSLQKLLTDKETTVRFLVCLAIWPGVISFPIDGFRSGLMMLSKFDWMCFDMCFVYSVCSGLWCVFRSQWKCGSTWISETGSRDKQWTEWICKYYNVCYYCESKKGAVKLR